LSEGIIKPEAEMRSVAIAEATVVEGIRNSLSRIADMVREVHEALRDLGQGMLESVRVRSDRIWESRKRASDELRNYVTHFIRVRLGLENRDLYHAIFAELRSLTRSLSDVSCILKEMALARDSPSNVSTALDASRSIVENIQSIVDATMTLLDNPRASVDLLEKSYRSLEDLESSYRESICAKASQLSRELLRTLLSIARSLSLISENLRFIAMQRM